MKKIIALLLALIMGFSLVACSPKEYDSDDDVSIKKATSSKKTVKGNDDDDIISSKKTVSSKKTTSSKKEESVSSKTTTKPASGKVSSNWEDLEFLLEGKKYTVPFSYKDIISAGWDYDKSKHGHQKGTLIDPDQSSNSRIDHQNKKYSHLAFLGILYKNNTSEPLDVFECDVYRVAFDFIFAIEENKKYPDIEIAKGITIGSTLKEVEAAFGKPKSSYYTGAHKYNSYTYISEDYKKEMIIDIHDKYGVIEISFKSK